MDLSRSPRHYGRIWADKRRLFLAPEMLTLEHIMASRRMMDQTGGYENQPTPNLPVLSVERRKTREKIITLCLEYRELPSGDVVIAQVEPDPTSGDSE